MKKESDDKQERRNKGEGSLREIEKGKWKAEITLGYENGKQIRKSITTNSRPEAVKALNKLKSEQQKGSLVATNTISFNDFCDRWLELKKATAKKKKTYADYEYIVDKHFKPALGKLKVQKVKTGHINNYIIEKLNAGISPFTVSQHRGILHNIFKYAITEKVISINPVIDATSVPKQKREQKILTEEQMIKVLEEAKKYQSQPGNHYKYVYQFILMALSTGLRRGELLALRWSNIDLVNSKITIKEQYVEIKGKHVIQPPKSSNSLRIISVDPKVLEVIKKDLYDESGGLLFKDKHGEPLGFTTIRQGINRMFDRCGVPRIRIHDMRHTHVTHLLSNGYDIKMISERIGDDIRTAMGVYAHALPEKDKEAADFIGSKLIK